MGGGRRHRNRRQPAHRGREEDQVSHGQRHPQQDRRAEHRGPAAGHIRPTARRCQTHHHARQRHRIRATAQRAGHGHILRRPIQFLAADNNENRNGMIRRHPPKHSRIRMDRRATCGKSSTRSATAPCACSTTAHPSRHSSKNC